MKNPATEFWRTPSLPVCSVFQNIMLNVSKHKTFEHVSKHKFIQRPAFYESRVFWEFPWRLYAYIVSYRLTRVLGRSFLFSLTRRLVYNEKAYWAREDSFFCTLSAGTMPYTHVKHAYMVLFQHECSTLDLLSSEKRALWSVKHGWHISRLVQYAELAAKQKRAYGVWNMVDTGLLFRHEVGKNQEPFCRNCKN